MIKDTIISKSSLELFLNCKRCFFLDKVLNIKRPPTYPYLLNSAVDILLKNEFDFYRRSKRKHPYLIKHNIDAIPYNHPCIEDWRKFNKGINYIHKKTGFLLRGSIDDIWLDIKTNELIIVEYKSTSKNGILDLDSSWQISYKRQIEFYQYLFLMNGFEVSNKGYFVYCNGLKNEQKFDNKLNFDVKLLEYEGNYEWIENSLIDIYNTFRKNTVPNMSQKCSYCRYINKTHRIYGE